MLKHKEQLEQMQNKDEESVGLARPASEMKPMNINNIMEDEVVNPEIAIAKKASLKEHETKRKTKQVEKQKQQQINDAELINEISNNYQRSRINRKDRLDAGTIEIFRPQRGKNAPKDQEKGFQGDQKLIQAQILQAEKEVDSDEDLQDLMDAEQDNNDPDKDLGCEQFSMGKSGQSISAYANQ